MDLTRLVPVSGSHLEWGGTTANRRFPGHHNGTAPFDEGQLEMDRAGVGTSR